MTVLIRMPALIAALVFVLALAPGAPASELRTVVLKDRLVTTDGVITLGDLFDNAGEAGEAALARAPAPGQRLSLDPAFVRAEAARQGLNWVNAGGVMRITVERAGRTVSTAQITGLIEEALYVETGQAHLIELSNRTQTLHAPMDSAGGPELVSLDVDARAGLFRAEIAPWPGAAPERMGGRVQPVTDVPVLARAVARGETLTSDHIRWERRPASQVRPDTLLREEALVGQEARRTLRADTPLRAIDVQAPVMITRGETVQLIYQVGGLVLTARARALDNAAEGQSARFLNLQSNRTVEAVAEGAGRARIAASSAFMN
ncbi:flagellar basal body P-ring formation protein FlgA [Alkalicaulis satelles]|uniref:Flagellar basal body P-ring formation protein FlgA n=1 Tax=Alkalicaulis satelles TaxID=2609175 RepID=A0A5M6ZI24_9PROT|nr:flagellar basal body P-ring formation chaperone FlgA [Alkalicaulis satelles]KAA5803347.1 flagellar basal body P-ring formation protein FlgA [Alkalicaulis satelles]